MFNRLCWKLFLGYPRIFLGPPEEGSPLITKSADPSRSAGWNQTCEFFKLSDKYLMHAVRYLRLRNVTRLWILSRQLLVQRCRAPRKECRTRFLYQWSQSVYYPHHRAQPKIIYFCKQYQIIFVNCSSISIVFLFVSTQEKGHQRTMW